MDVTDVLKRLLEQGVLFQSVEIPDIERLEQGFGRHPGHLAMVPASLELPEEIRLFCSSDKCQAVMDWQLFRDGEIVEGDVTIDRGFSATEYRCRHTPKTNRVTFFIAATNTETSTTVRLVGRDPQPTPYLTPQLQEALGEIDRDRYSKALSCRASGLGIAALVYVRRVVEGEMDRLLDLMVEALPDADQAIRDALVRLKGSYQFSEKAAVADAKLPPSFFPGSQNPFARLHDLTSQGVHELDDAESCERFDGCRDLFEMLFEKLLRDRDTQRVYRERLTSLKRKSAKE